MDDERTRTLVIDGEAIRFTINVGNNAGAVGAGGHLPRGDYYLAASDTHGWREVLPTARPVEPDPIWDQFADAELISLYLEARTRG